MKQALILKYADLGGQLLMLFPLLGAGGNSISDRLFWTYCSVGSWQLLSLVVHLALSPAGVERRRKYTRLLGSLAVMLLIGAAFAGIDYILNGPQDMGSIATIGGWFVFPVLVVLMFGSPFFAAWYFTIGLNEIRALHAATQHRREIHWKL